MNKIIIENNCIKENIVDSRIEIIEKSSIVSSIKIIFKESTDLKVIYSTSEDTKLNVEYILLENVQVNLYELRNGFKTKVQYKYDIKSNAKLYLYRINKSNAMREVDLIDLNGVNSHIEFNLRTLSNKEEKYDIYVAHNEKYTSSNINNIGIALKGNIIFNVTGEISKGNSGSKLDQNNQIVTFNASKCQINPNLLIDEYDVEAEHNAIIGKFDDQILFYLMSRGIKENDAIKLLCEGLILNKLKESYSKEEILDFIQEYWG